MAASKLTLEDAVSSYGRAVKAKLSAIIHGEPEDQLRNPLERLLTDLVQLSALDPQRLTLVGETLISDLKTRPDFAASYADQPIGSIVHLDGDIASASFRLVAPNSLLTLVQDFVSWSPIPPRTPKQLAELTAHLCRLLRDEVSEQLDAGDPRLLGLADRDCGMGKNFSRPRPKHQFDDRVLAGEGPLLPPLDRRSAIRKLRVVGAM